MNKIYLDAYTDASSYNNGRKDPSKPEHSASAGFILYDNIIIDSQYNFNPNSSISYGELFAIYMIINEVYQIATESEQKVVLSLYSDSSYCVQSINVWSKGWRKHINRRGEWTNSSGEPVVYQEMLEAILDMMDTEYLKVKIYHVSGHVFESKKKFKKAFKVFARINGFEPSEDELSRHSVFNDIVDNYAKAVLELGLKGKIKDERQRKKFRKYLFGNDS